MTWKPHVTVSAIVHRDGKFLLVRETSDDREVINQPSGHLEEGETLLQAVIRETLEEAACHIKPAKLLGIYKWKSPTNNRTYMRFAFICEVTGFEQGRELDDGIIEAVWLDRSELQANSSQLRSPMVLQCIDDYLRGQQYPLALLNDSAP